jgi:hypothetical protein
MAAVAMNFDIFRLPQLYGDRFGVWPPLPVNVMSAGRTVVFPGRAVRERL